MSIYAIGDVQGCYNELMSLLDHIQFDEQNDQLWFVGDLVNRGPQSLEVLRFVKNLGHKASTVLGNHDLHLVAVALGYKKAHSKDTLDSILAAEDRDELIHWLRNLPLLHESPGSPYTMIHAGLPPQWDIGQARLCANEAEAVFSSDAVHEFLPVMYGNKPDQWSEELRHWDRIRFITNCFTRLRYCDANGKLALEQKGPPGSQPDAYAPWFNSPGRKTGDRKIIFGHWSTLGKVEQDNVYPLDTGCLWGGNLTCMRLEDEETFSLDCAGAMKPEDA